MVTKYTFLSCIHTFLSNKKSVKYKNYEFIPLTQG